MKQIEGIEDALESEPLARYGLTYVGSGASKVCFETTGSDRKLIKVDRDDLASAIKLALDGGDTEQVFSLQKKRRNAYQEQEDALAAAFGPDHVLRKGAFRFTVPVTPEIAAAVLGPKRKTLASRIDGVLEIRSLIETQQIAEELKDRDAYRTIDMQIPLMDQDDFRGTQNVDTALRKIDGMTSRHIDRDARQLKENGYLGIAQEVIRGMVAYTKGSGMMVDLFGTDNVTLFTGIDGKPDFHLVDPILPGPRELWDQNISSDTGFSLLRHYYSYLCGVNKLAEALGMKERLEPEDLVYFKGASLPEGEWPKR